MERHLDEVMSGTFPNYIYPFFWLHGESEEALVREVHAIYESGAKAMCLESRTHHQFCEDEWWRDCDIIIREAKKLGMKIWILDDKHFPSGYANGLVAKKYPERRRWHLVELHVDVVGPMKNAALLIKHKGADFGKKERSLIAVIACKREEKQEVMSGECYDLTDCVKGDYLYWDVPYGVYRIFMIFKSREGSAFPDYISMIDGESVDVLLEAVYEPHYERYKEEFGNTIEGFFSDEPGFYNTMCAQFKIIEPMNDRLLGIPYQAIPWREDFVELLETELGENAKVLLPAFWYDMGEKTARFRYVYLNMLTRLYRECFCEKLGNWCLERGVKYMGHVIEEFCLGTGAGHYFRATAGQDVAGVDVVLHQVIPGLEEYMHTAWGSRNLIHPEMNYYVLGKLASSHSHINPRMKGRAMCEIFGAYGWAEGTPLMKWLLDHMLVRGNNCFVPHAFTTVFPDNDCPPHFYAQGNNIQYRDFAKLMVYANKMCHLFSEGRHIAPVALLYDMDSKWACDKVMPTGIPAKALYDTQIDYDIVDCDCILERAHVENEKLFIHQESYSVLVLPEVHCLPKEVLQKLREFAKQKLLIIMINSCPMSIEGERIEIPEAKVCTPEELPQLIQDYGMAEFILDKPFKQLRIYHYERAGAQYVMCFNESMETFSGLLQFPFEGRGVKLDLLNGHHQSVDFKPEGTSFELQPYESCVFGFECGMDLPSEAALIAKDEFTLEDFEISLCTAENYPMFTPAPIQELHNITSPDCLPEFSGFIRYQTEVSLEQYDKVLLDLGMVGEMATVYINGKYIESRICRPYVFDISREINPGENVICIEVTNSMVYSMKDILSTKLLLSPSGLLGPVKLHTYHLQEGD